MNKNKNYIKERLESAAENNWDTYRTIFFNDKELFRNSLETVYSYIANRTVRSIMKDEIDLDKDYELYRIKPINIHTDAFKNLFERFRINGKVCSISYSTLLHNLATENIIYQNRKYKTNEFSKSYSLNNDFIRDVKINSYIDKNHLYKSFIAYYPNRLLERTAKENKDIFNKIKKECEFPEDLDFNEDFFNNYSTFGWYFNDDRLDVNEMNRDLKTFQKHTQGRYIDHRYYDWFTSISSAFRTHITVNNKHYREAYDFHSGMYWMLSIYGWMNGKIDLEETERMIDHCFYGNFYADISEQPKSKEIKEKFMVYLNSHNGVHKQMFVSDDKDFKTISNNLWKHYPQWTKMIQQRRCDLKGDVGYNNFIDSTEIEKELYLRIEMKLNEMGYTNIRRVHDAIYTIEDVDDIEQIVRETVDEYMADSIS